MNLTWLEEQRNDGSVSRMEQRLRPEGDNIRLSNSPGRSPLITQAVTSPARSVHPEMQGLDSIHTQSDLGLRTADFLDDTSEDESPQVAAPGIDAHDVELLDRRRTGNRKRQSGGASQTLASRCEPKRVSLPPEDGYHRLAAGPGPEIQSRFTDTPSTSFNGSVDELLPGEHSSPPHFSRPARVRTPRISMHVEPEEEQRQRQPSKADQILGAHAIAHEITLQSLMRDEEALDRGLQSFAPMRAEYRASMMPDGLRMHDPRSPRAFATPQSAASKKVHVVPPPIDTSGAPRRSRPENLVRTPYPYTPERVHRKDFWRSPPSATPSAASATESILTLSIRRANAHSLPRVTSLTIPASTIAGPIGIQGAGFGEEHPSSIEFDDAELFQRIRRCYRELSGTMHFIGARSLTRIAVSGPASRAADAGYGWLHQPRSSRALAYRGLSDTFSEAKILRHYRKPGLGRSRYAFVHWAHRLSAAPPVRTPQFNDDVRRTVDRDLVRKLEQPEGLEFVISWSILRITLALFFTICLSIAAALLWIFLGRNTISGVPHGGLRDAGDRLGPGILVGICVLLIGLSGIAGWLGVSWLVM